MYFVISIIIQTYANDRNRLAKECTSVNRKKYN